MIISIIRGGRGLKNDHKYHNFLSLFLVPSGKMMINIVRGGGQRVMIGIIISVNDENDGQSITIIQIQCSLMVCNH